MTDLEKHVSSLLSSSQRSEIVFQLLHWNCCLNTEGHNHAKTKIRIVIIPFSRSTFLTVE